MRRGNLMFAILGTEVGLVICLILLIFAPEPRVIKEVETVKVPVIIEKETTVYIAYKEANPTLLDYLGEFEVTAYCGCEKCCGGGKTATGTIPTENRTIAVDPKIIPYGSHVIINGQEYIAEDTGGAIKGNRIDIYFKTHEEAVEFGRQDLEVYIQR